MNHVSHHSKGYGCRWSVGPNVDPEEPGERNVAITREMQNFRAPSRQPINLLLVEQQISGLA